MYKYFLIFLIILGSISGCSTNNSINIGLDYIPNTNHIGIYVAKELGYYGDLNVNIIKSGDISVETLIDQQQLDVGFSYSENVLQAINSNLKVQSNYAIFNHNSSALISKKDKNIISINDLINKTYCGWGSEFEQKLLESFVGEKIYNTMQIKTTTTDFINSPDSCDIFWIYEGWTDVYSTLNNIEYNIIPLNNIDFYTPVIISNPTIDNKNLYLFFKKTAEGYNYAKNNPQHATEIFLKYNPEYDYNFIFNSLEKIKSNINSSGYQNPDIWNNFINYCYKYNLIDNNIDNPYTNKYINGENNANN